MKETNTDIKMSTGIFINDSGEILAEFYEGDIVSIRRKEQQEYANNHYIGFSKGESFVKLIVNNVIPLFRELSKPEYAVAMALTSFISYDDCIIRFNNKVLDVKDIHRLLNGTQENKGYENTRRIINNLIKKEVLIYDYTFNNNNKRIKCLIANPYIFFKGSDILKRSADLFKDSKWYKQLQT